MPKLFGLSIDKLVYGGIKAAGDVRPLTLVKVTPGVRDPDNLLGGTNPTTTSHTGRGLSATPRLIRSAQGNMANDIIETFETEIFVFGASIMPVAVPESSDFITIDGVTWTVTNVGSDSSAAVYTCRATSRA